jgi:hypothetical protein
MPCSLTLLEQTSSGELAFSAIPAGGDDLPIYAYNPDSTDAQTRFKLQMTPDDTVISDIVRLKFSDKKLVTENVRVTGDYPSNYISLDYTKREVLKTSDFSIEYRKRDT